MATRISVTVKGPLGLDEPDQMLADLDEATGLGWRRRPSDAAGQLGVGEIVLEAVVGQVVGMSAQAAHAHVLRLVRRWRSGRMDPPRIDVGEEELPEAGTEPADGAPPDGAAHGAGG